MQRDGHTCRRCGEDATDVDHVVAGDDHRLGNLQSLCTPCHRAKTAREGAAARVWRPRRRSPEPHPGAAA